MFVWCRKVLQPALFCSLGFIVSGFILVLFNHPGHRATLATLGGFRDIRIEMLKSLTDVRCLHISMRPNSPGVNPSHLKSQLTSSFPTFTRENHRDGLSSFCLFVTCTTSSSQIRRCSLSAAATLQIIEGRQYVDTPSESFIVSTDHQTGAGEEPSISRENADSKHIKVSPEQVMAHTYINR